MTDSGVSICRFDSFIIHPALPGARVPVPSPRDWPPSTSSTESAQPSLASSRPICCSISISICLLFNPSSLPHVLRLFTSAHCCSWLYFPLLELLSASTTSSPPWILSTHPSSCRASLCVSASERSLEILLLLLQVLIRASAFFGRAARLAQISAIVLLCATTPSHPSPLLGSAH
jgi:hypothetical protein